VDRGGRRVNQVSANRGRNLQRATGDVSWSPKLNKLARRRIRVSDYTLRAHYMTTGPSGLNQRATTRGWLPFPSGLAARGESPASHRGRPGAPLTRRDDREYREYLREEQRSQTGAPTARTVRRGVERGCIAGRMQLEFHHGLLSGASQCPPLRDRGVTELSRPFRAGTLPGWTSALRHRTGLDLRRNSVEAVSRRPAVIADASGTAVQGFRELR
jgi:hypothetical protein